MIHTAKKEYPDFIESTGYGTGDGLCGWNCRHHFQAWDERLKNPYTDENGNLKIDTDENRKLYELQQKQRSMERAIRKTKRRLIEKGEQINLVPDAEKDKLQKEYDKLSYHWTQQNKAYNDFCKANDLQPQYDRTKLADFGTAQTKRANKAARNYEKNK